MGSTITFPIKAPTRQMLYPLSYRGTFKAEHVSISKTDVNRDASADAMGSSRGVFTLVAKQKEIARRGDLFSRTREIELMQRVCVLWSQRTRDGH